MANEPSSFYVSPHGEDIDNCFYNGNCRTITYIIENKCQQEKHVIINVQADKEWLYQEPAFATYPNNNIFLCYVTIVGGPDDNKATVTADKNDGNSNIFTHLLSASPQTTQPCQTQHDIYFENYCYEPKLRFNNIILVNFTILISSNTLLSDNVHFENVHLFNFAESMHACSFYCSRCLLKHNQRIDVNNNTNNIFSSEMGNDTEHEIDYMINFQNCTTVTLQLHETELISTGLSLSFLSGVYADLRNVKVNRSEDSQMPPSQIILEQLNQTIQMNDDVIDKSSHLLFHNFQCYNKSVGELDNVNISRPAIMIRLIDVENTKSNVTFVEADVISCSAFLHYSVQYNNFTDGNDNNPDVDEDKRGTNKSRENSNSKHLIQFNKLHMRQNLGLSYIISIEQQVKGRVTFTDCYFHENELSDMFYSHFIDVDDVKTSAVALKVTEGDVLFENCNFENNNGALGGILNIGTTDFHNVSLCIVNCVFKANSVVQYTGQVSGYGGAIFLESKYLVLEIHNCSFDDNVASFGGAIFLQSRTSLIDSSVIVEPFEEPKSEINKTVTKDPSFPLGPDIPCLNEEDIEYICLKGPAGNPGPAGPPGPKGMIGLPEVPGPAGLMGPIGLAGPRGATGSSGPSARERVENRKKRDVPAKDDSKLEFVLCPKKYSKDPCKKCIVGPKGPDGPAGYPGSLGFPGTTGNTGPQGAPGYRGAPGLTGATGATGPSGYLIQRQKRYTNPYQESDITSIKKTISSRDDCESGPIGPRGPPGPPGPPGSPGYPGAPGSPGATGYTGLPGPVGAIGPVGENYTVNDTSFLPILPRPVIPIPEQPEIQTQPARYIYVGIYDSNFTKNIGYVFGGAIMLSQIHDQLDLHIERSFFLNNQADSAGGTISLFGEGCSNILWKDLTFEANLVNHTGTTSEFYGGSVLMTNQSVNEFLIEDSFIIDNSATEAFTFGTSLSGTINVKNYKVANFSIQNTIVSGNKVKIPDGFSYFYGTGHHISPVISISILSCIIFDNIANDTDQAGFLMLRVPLQSGKISVTVIDSNMSTNVATDSLGGAIYLHVVPNSEVKSILLIYLDIQNTVFRKNNAHRGGAICLTFYKTNCKIQFKNVSFDHNGATWGGGAVGISTFSYHLSDAMPDFQFYLEQVTFTSNWAKSSHSWNENGGAVDVSLEDKQYICDISLSGLIVFNNTSNGHGGGLAFAIPENELNFTLINSIFTSNEVGTVSRGGALYVSMYNSKEISGPPEMRIENSIFKDNRAGEGGSVYQATPISSPGRLIISNCEFFCCSNSSNVSRIVSGNGSLLFASLSTHMYQVHFVELPILEDSFCPAPGLVLYNDGDSHHIRDVNYTCIETKLRLKMPPVNNSVNSLLINCLGCTYLPYTFGNGTLTIKDTSLLQSDEEELVTHIEEACMSCPFGGDCSDGSVIARPNYWGYHNHQGLKAFQSCPQGYCCNNIHVKCESYNTCALHREGRLCGTCRSGYSESLMSRACIANEKCKDWWLWPAGLFLAFTYLIWYMYKGEVTGVFGFFVVKLSSLKLSKFNSVRENDTKISKVDPYFPEKVQIKDSDPGTNEDKAYFDILVYFVNIISLLKVKVEFKSASQGDGFLYDIEKYFTRYVDVDMQQVANVTLCPFQGIGARTKYLARPGFVVAILLIWSSLYTMLSWMLPALIFKVKKTGAIQWCKSLRLKLIEGYVETMKYSYSGLAGVTFLFLTCVEMNDKMFWKYNAEIECLSTWQYGVIAFAILYTFPFSITTILGAELLQKGTIGYVQFMLACLFPLPFLIYWIIAFISIEKSGQKKKVSIKALAVSTKNVLIVGSDKEDLSMESKVVLRTFQGSYKDSHSSWEGVIEFRKLFFNTYYLINNNIYRLVCCTITAVIVLVHHNFTNPFKHHNSNRAESLSLSLLCIACVTNSIKTVFTESGILVEPNTPLKNSSSF